MPPSRLFAALAVLALSGAHAAAQPTYKLEVGKHLRPAATIRLDGATVTRSAVKNDPGFRLQYRFTRDGKEVAVVDARARPAAELPVKEAGTFVVGLELFHPTYKPGKQQRGEFRLASNVLVYRVEPPGKVTPVGPALVLECGRDGDKGQERHVEKGYGYKLLQGQPGAGGPRWEDPKLLRFELTVPPGTGGALRLHFVDGDGKKRKQQVNVQGKPRVVIEGFEGEGIPWTLLLPSAEVPGGRIEVAIQALTPGASAVVSGVEFVPWPGKK